MTFLSWIERLKVNSEQRLTILFVVLLLLDSISVIPVYALNSIDKLSGTWLLGILSGLSLLMFPGIVFYIYAALILFSKSSVLDAISGRKKFLWFVSLLIFFIGIGVLFYAIAVGFVNEWVPPAFYVAISLLAVSFGLVWTLAKNSWKEVKPLPKWFWIELILLTFLALPWIFAHIGVYVSRIPILNLIFVAEQPGPSSYGVTVHLGNHHGFSGYLMIITSQMMLYQWLTTKTKKSQKLSFGVLLSLIQGYGLYLFVEDFINEQLYRFFQRELLPTYEFIGLNVATYIILGLSCLLFLLNWFLILSKSTTLQSNVAIDQSNINA